MTVPVKLSPRSTSPPSVRQCIRSSLYSEEIFDLPGAVHERIQMNAHAIEQREVEVGQIRSLRVADMPPALQSGPRAARHQDRKILVVVNAGIPDAASIQIDRV